MPKISSSCFFLFSVFALCGGPSRVALAAAEQIGLAVVVRNSVSQVEPKAAKILQGDDIVRDEVVQTLADSNAKFVLKDDTNLMLGPNSRLKLDRAVFSGDKNFGEVALKLGVGAFRFVTGNSPKELHNHHPDRHNGRSRHHSRFSDRTPEEHSSPEGWSIQCVRCW